MLINLNSRIIYCCQSFIPFFVRHRVRVNTKKFYNSVTDSTIHYWSLVSFSQRVLLTILPLIKLVNDRLPYIYIYIYIWLVVLFHFPRRSPRRQLTGGSFGKRLVIKFTVKDVKRKDWHTSEKWREHFLNIINQSTTTYKFRYFG